MKMARLPDTKAHPCPANASREYWNNVILSSWCFTIPFAVGFPTVFGLATESIVGDSAIASEDAPAHLGVTMIDGKPAQPTRAARTASPDIAPWLDAAKSHIDAYGEDKDPRHLHTAAEDLQEATEELILSKAATKKDRMNRLALLSIMITALLVYAATYFRVHQITPNGLLNSPQAELAGFTFYGTPLTGVLGMGFEVFFFSSVGLTLRQMYEMLPYVCRGRVQFWERLTTWVIEMCRIPILAVMILFILSATTFAIGDRINITLDELPSGVIIGLAFILGYFPRESTDILGKLLPRIPPNRYEEASSPTTDPRPRPKRVVPFSNAHDATLEREGQ